MKYCGIYQSGELPEVGDVVECIEAVTNGDVKEGETYTVVAVRDEYVCVNAEFNKEGWYASRFKLKARRATTADYSQVAGHPDFQSRVEKLPLFVIRKRCENQYWTCSAEHGSGWNPGKPKQAFSPSELANQIARLAREGWCDVLISQLSGLAN